MPAQTWDLIGPFRIEQGATWNPVITYYTDATKTAVNDLTGYKATAVWSAKAGGPAIVSLSSDDGTITLGGSAGTVAPKIGASVTNTLPPLTDQNPGRWQLDLIDPDGNDIRLLEGDWALSPKAAS